MKTIEKKYTQKIPALKILTLLFLSALFLGSCKKLATSEPELQSALNVVNATIDMPQIGFFINGSKVQGPPLKYTEYSGYFITSPGTRSFDVAADGIPDYVLKTSVAFKQNTYHTIFVVGEIGSISAFFTDDNLDNPPAGKAKLRFIHLSPDGGNLVLAPKNGSVLFPEQTYKTSSEFMVVDPGVYDLQIKTAAGTVLAEQNVTIAAGSIYNVLAKGMRAGTSNSPLGLQFQSFN